MVSKCLMAIHVILIYEPFFMLHTKLEELGTQNHVHDLAHRGQ